MTRASSPRAMIRFARPVLLLDLDGTLVDSVADLAASVDAMLGARALPPLGPDAVRDLIGDGAAMLIRRAFAARGVAEPPDDAAAHFRELYAARCIRETRAYPGISELVARLAAGGRRLAVVTNKPQALSEAILHGLGLAPHLQAVVGPELAPEKKPSPAHVLAALSLLGAEPADAVMIGDGPTDIASGRDAGAATIGVLWGYRPASELQAEGADALVATADELASLVT